MQLQSPLCRRSVIGGSQRTSVLMEKPEGVGPFVFREAKNAPKHAQWLDGSGGFGLAQVGGLPAKLVIDLVHDGFSVIVVAANEHGRFAAFVFRVDHPGVADGVVSLDEMRVGDSGLQLLHQR